MGICEVDDEGPRKIGEELVQLHYAPKHFHFAQLDLNQVF